MKIFKSITVIAISLVLFSCGSGNKNETKTDKTSIKSEEKVWKEFKVFAEGNTMAEMKFNIENITVNSGDWVRIILENEGVDLSMVHNIVFIKYGTRKEVSMQSIDAGPENSYVVKSDNVIAYSELANPGETVTLEFQAPKKGNYEFLCTYPGHAEIMRGYFFVK